MKKRPAYTLSVLKNASIAEPPKLLAVSKAQTAAAMRTAYRAGQTAFGENYLQEAIDKQGSDFVDYAKGVGHDQQKGP